MQCKTRLCTREATVTTRAGEQYCYSCYRRREEILEEVREKVFNRKGLKAVSDYLLDNK